MFNMFNANKNNLFNQKEIRVVINTGMSLGNQGACFALMKRLKEAGFKGKFHIVYNEVYNNTTDSIGRKIKHFVPSYDENGPKKQIYSEGVIEKINPSEGLEDLPYVPIGITGANDGSFKAYQGFCQIYNCGAFISLKPLYWDKGVNKMELLDGTVQEWSLDLRMLGNTESTIKLEEINNEKESRLLAEVLEAKKRGVDFQSIYGLRPITEDDAISEFKNPMFVEKSK